MKPNQHPSRIAKWLARSGLGSRRYCEQLVFQGKVLVNNQRVINPATKVLGTDVIKVDGRIIPQPQKTRIWLYHKPVGLITTRKDEKNRPTIFDSFPTNLPYTMSIGRLDINSEGLLLLTNDGELKRFMELPINNFVREYKVRVLGDPTDKGITQLRKGIVVEGMRYSPMKVSLGTHSGVNSWLTIVIKEGKNREIRRALMGVGLKVNRLIRVTYGPFQLGDLLKNQVVEGKISLIKQWKNRIIQ